MKIVFAGLTISSSWGNGHATTYRGLLKGLHKLGHEVHFLEWDKPWYRDNRDFNSSETYNLHFYHSLDELRAKYEQLVQQADLVVVGSYVPDGIRVGEWVVQTARSVTAFYDIDTPVTLHKLDEGDREYLSADLIPQFDLYLSFAGGKALEILEEKYKAQLARPFYCSVDPDLYYPEEEQKQWKLGYLGTYSDDRQPMLNELLIEPAKILKDEKFVVAGPSYPETIQWPDNVERTEHLPPHKHLKFYNRQHLTLNVTRKAMTELGHSPSVRLFEAAACGTPILSDFWVGLDELFKDQEEIFIARNKKEAQEIISGISDENLLRAGRAAREKVLAGHTANHRAEQLIEYYEQVLQVGVTG